jgi:hypothetical protein
MHGVNYRRTSCSYSEIITVKPLCLVLSTVDPFVNIHCLRSSTVAKAEHQKRGSTVAKTEHIQ